jgi:leader peptidase (prepilin peptidase) / N-methyltransferase
MPFIDIFVFLFGIIIGSFLNAVIYRLSVEEGKKGGSALRGRSYCPDCRHNLSWLDLIPVISFVLLQGRCRYCRKQISWQYPLVELGTALLFMAGTGVLQTEHVFYLLYFWVIASLLVVLFVYDLRHYILPDKIVFPAIGIVFGYRVFEFLSFSNWNLIENWSLKIENVILFVNPLFAGILASVFFLTIFLFSRGRAMGFGDVKLAFFMGLFLGWPNIVVALFAAFMAGAVVGLALILLKKKGMKSEVPFGPFLIGGTFVALFWGKFLVDWYFTIVLI